LVDYRVWWETDPGGRIHGNFAHPRPVKKRQIFDAPGAQSVNTLTVAKVLTVRVNTLAVTNWSGLVPDW
jgi:hypothetical protein